MEDLGLILLVACAMAITNEKRRVKKEAEAFFVSPSAEREVDPTRWRHDGRQAPKFKDGNKSASSFEEEGELLQLLAF